MTPLSILDEALQPLVLDHARTGSRVICNPPELDTDDDYVVLVRDANAFRLQAVELGWETSEGSEVPQFESFRKVDVNLIVTTDEAFFKRFDAATHVAARLNLRNKDDRIALFQAVLYANKWTPEPAESGSGSSPTGKEK